MAETEKQFLEAIVQLARLCGWLVYHTHDSRRSEPGFPDLVLVRGEQLIIAELKAAKGRLSAAQERWIEALMTVEAAIDREIPEAMVGLFVYVWRPSDWDEIVRVLR